MVRAMDDPAVPVHRRRRPRDGPPPDGPTGADVDPIRPARSVAVGGYTVLVGGPDGAIEDGGDGLWDLDARIVSRHRLRLDGVRPRPLGSCVANADHWAATLVVPRPGGDAVGPHLPQDAWSVRIERTVGCGMAETITIRNESMVEATGRWTLELGSHVVDRLAATAEAPQVEHGRRWVARDARLELTTTFRANDREDVRALAVIVDPPPTAVDILDDDPAGACLSFDLALPARGERTIALTYRSFADGEWRDPADARGRAELADRWRSQRTKVTTTDRLVGPAVELAADDLLTLRAWELEPSDDGSAWMTHAGVPGFTGYFGRDTITAGWQAAMLGPEPLRGALEIATRTQGRRSVPFTEEEPGRMVHEMRRGPVAMLGVRPHRAYYGSFSTGSLAIIGLSETWHWTADDALLRRHLDAMLRVVTWAETLGDLDGDGFIEYHQRNPDALKNQAWKDSNEAIRWPDGAIVDNPIATVEEQAFHYLALERMAEILVGLGDPTSRAADLLERAGRLRDAWHAAFWIEEDGAYAMALDGEGRPVRSAGSNPGHALAAGIVPPTKAAAVADRLLAEDLFSGWGIRTLSTEHPSYNPLAYHLGAVWPVENATIMLGLKRYGLDDHLDQLLEGLFAAVAHCRDLRLPEALTGHDRSVVPTPLPYPGSQSPQAWSSSAVVLALQVMLGLYPFAPARVLGLVRPRLPAWLPTVTLHGLRIGAATVTIRFDREADGGASHTILEQDGTLFVVEVPPPDAVAGSDGVGSRLLGRLLELAPGRTATALRIALGDDDALRG